ncbi:hypothetical protein CLAIMM_02011 [Cladophialophora immunda]|nr:hypothetical protein CLAIMM_02011 [Cladophialophora immunda]
MPTKAPAPAVIAFTSKTHSDSYPEIDPSALNQDGRHVMIAGASRGIGREMALSFAKAGASAIAVGARSDLSTLVKEIEAVAVQFNKPKPKVVALMLDVADEKSASDAANKVRSAFGYIDILINNAGIVETPLRKIAVSDPTQWLKVLTVNVFGPFLVSRAFLPLLLEQEQGQKTIINITSMAAHMIFPRASAYGISKLGVVRLTEFLDEEYGDQGLLAYSVHPGQIMTALGESMPTEVHEQLTDTVQLPAHTVTFLTQTRQDWLAGRYIACSWDMPEMLARKEEVIKGDKLKVRMQV